MDAVDVITITALVVVFTIFPAIAICWWHWDSVKVQVQSGVNDDEAAAMMFIDVLKQAERTLVIYDDGNKMGRSVYDNERVIEAVRNHLSCNEALVIRCLFNDKEDIDLVQQMQSEHPARFRVWYRSGPRPQGDVHYKIADDGVIGHLSSHGYAQPERRFKLLDGSAAKPRTRKMALGKYLERFETDIRDHAMAAA